MQPELLVIPAGSPPAAPLRLSLGVTAPPLRLGGGPRPAVTAAGRYAFRLAGMSLPHGASVAVLLADAVLASGAVRGELHPGETLDLPPRPGPAPFGDVVGLLTLEVRITPPYRDRGSGLDEGDAEEGGTDVPEGRESAQAGSSGLPERLLSEPVELLLPEGAVLDNLNGMAERVRRGRALLLVPEDAGMHAAQTGGIERRLGAWEAFVDRLEPLVERVRRHPKLRLVTTERIDSPSRAAGFSERAVRFIVEHPDELVPAAGGTGFSVPGAGAAARGFTPRRVLVESTGFSLDLPEHRMLLGFLVRLEEQARREHDAVTGLHAKLAAALKDEAAAEPAGGRLRSSASAEFVLALGRLEDLSARATRLVDRLRTVCRGCMQALGLTPAAALRLAALPEAVPHPTRLFLAPGPYRQLFDCMTGWKAPETAAAEERAFFEGMRRSRLYEQFVLIELLDVVRSLGFRPEPPRHVGYAGAGALYAAVDHANVFPFVLEEEGRTVRLTLWYQPVVSSGETAGEQGIGLMRASRYSLSPTGGVDGASALDPRPPARPYYTPDFLLCVEQASERRWFILDAKFSKVSSVFLFQTPNLVYKYLFSIRPMTRQDRIEALWLLCGNALEEPPGAVSPLGEDVSGAGFQVERCDARVRPDGLIAALSRIVRAPGDARHSR